MYHTIKSTIHFTMAGYSFAKKPSSCMPSACIRSPCLIWVLASGVGREGGGLGIMFPLREPEHRQPKYRGSKKAKFMPTNPGLERELGIWTLKGLRKENFYTHFSCSNRDALCRSSKKLPKGWNSLHPARASWLLSKRLWKSFNK